MYMVLTSLFFTEHYDLKNPEEKNDIIPEIWEGHNIADFIDPDIEEVAIRIHSLSLYKKLIIYKKLKKKYLHTHYKKNI